MHYVPLRNIIRATRALLLVGLLSGCAGAAVQRRPAPQPQHQLVLLRQQACCSGAARELVTALRHSLRQSGNVKLLDPPGPLQPPRESVSAAAAIRGALQQAHAQYVSMRVDEARATLDTALAAVRRTVAQELTPSELARIHLYLGALAQAENQTQRADRHFSTAIAFEKDLQPDPDTFSPLVRDALDRARFARRTTAVAINSVPPGARVTWDGEQLSQPAPVELADQALGEHYLRLELPLHEPWADRIRISAKAQLEITLRPLPVPALLAVALRQPETRPSVVRLLGVEGLLLIAADGEGLQLELAARDRQTPMRLALPARAGAPLVGAAARQIALALGAERREATPAASMPAAPRHVEPRARASFLRRTWWAWAAAGAAVLAISIALPVALDDAPGRDIHLKLPRP